MAAFKTIHLQEELCTKNYLHGSLKHQPLHIHQQHKFVKLNKYYMLMDKYNK